MKKLACCFVIFLQSFFCFSQPNPKLDSLKKVLAKLPVEGKSFASDTMRVKVLCEMGEETEKFELKQELFEDAIEISEKNNWVEGVFNSSFDLGKKMSDLGYDFIAIDAYFKALTAAEKLKNTSKVGTVYRRLGDAYLILEDFGKAEKFYLKALENLNKKTELRTYLLSQNNLGLVYYNRNQFDKAINLFEDCLLKNSHTNNKVFDTFCIGNIAACYKKMGKFDKAVELFNQNLQIASAINDFPISDKVYTTLQIAELYLLKNDLNNAKSNIENAELNYSSLNSYTQSYLYEVGYKVYKKLGYEKKALEYHEKFVNLKETSTKEDFRKKLNALQVEYDNQKQKVEIETQKSTIEKNELLQKILWVGIAIVLLFFGFQFWNNQILKKKNILIEAQRAEITELNQNLEQKVVARTEELSQANQELVRKNEEILTALVEGQTMERKRVGVELHDNLGAMLSGMKWRLQALNKDKLPEKEQKVYEGILSMMGEAYSEVRLISHNMLPAELEKSGLIGALKKLIDDINNSEKINFIFENEEIIIQNKKVEIELYSICLELINNLLKHSQATEAKLSIGLDSNYLVLMLKDNGIGLSADVQKNGMGAKNIATRLRSISGNLKQLKLEKGAGYLIEIPLQI